MATHAAPRRLRTGSARDRAADVLVRVETEGAFGAPVLSAAVDRAPALSVADRALCTELVYGVLRTIPALDRALARHISRTGSLASMEPYARTVLRLAAYQILALSRVPPRAAINEAVGAIKRDRSQGIAGFANAVLRKLAAERPESLADDARATLAIESVPDEVLASIASAVGSRDEARSVLAAAFAHTPAIGLRTQTLRIDREQLEARLRTEIPAGEFTQGTVSPWALRLSGGGDPRTSRAFTEGLFAIQEEGAQAIAVALGARPGMRVLDACAGRGGKTSALALAMEATGVLHAVELHPEKAARIEDALTRLGLVNDALSLAAFAADLTRGLGGLGSVVPEGGYDRIMLDAPCSGLGTIARRPDLLRRREGTTMASNVVLDDDVDDDVVSSANGPSPNPVTDALSRVSLPDLQSALLDRVAPLVKPGGILLYAVCTLDAREGREVVDAFRSRRPAFVPCEGDGSLPEVLRPSAFVLRPDRDGTDGFMAFRLRCEKKS